MPGVFIVGQIVPDQVAFLGDDRAGWFVLKFTLVCLFGGRFREQETVISGHNDVAAVEVVHDVSNDVSQFTDGFLSRLESVGFGRHFVADSINLVVIHVDDLLAIDQLSAFFLLQLRQVIGLDRHSFDFGEYLVAFVGAGSRDAIGQNIAFVGVLQLLVRQQAGHAQSGVGRQDRKLRRQFALETVLTVQNPSQFGCRFVAKGITDDDERSAVIGFVLTRSDVLLVKIVLIGDAWYFPLVEQPAASRIHSNELRPLQ